MTQGSRDLVVHGIMQRLRSPQVATTLLRHARGEMARPGLAMLEFSAGRDPETLLGSLVCLHLGHTNTHRPKFSKS